MTRSLVALLLIVGLTAGPALAGPRKVLVLPLDGTAEPATRTRLSASLQKMARVLDGEVIAGDATFNDTATAIGCDPTKPACVESVRATLAVDELVFGTADEDAGTVTLIVKRSMKGKPPREVTRSFAASTPPQKVEVELLPVFSSEPRPDGSTDLTDPAVDPVVPTGPEPVAPTPPGGSRRGRTVAIAITAGGGVLLVLGLSLWSSKAGLQDDIDSHPTNTRAEIEDLQELEDKASSRAWAGNLFVVAGLAVAAYGGWRIYRDHQEHKQQALTIAPVPVEGGAAVILRGVL